MRMDRKDTLSSLLFLEDTCSPRPHPHPHPCSGWCWLSVCCTWLLLRLGVIAAIETLKWSSKGKRALWKTLGQPVWWTAGQGSKRNSEVLKEGTGWEDLGGAHQCWAQNWTNLQLYRERIAECVATKGPLGIRSLPTQKLLQISPSGSKQ